MFSVLDGPFVSLIILFLNLSQDEYFKFYIIPQIIIIEADDHYAPDENSIVTQAF